MDLGVEPGNALIEAGPQLRRAPVGAVLCILPDLGEKGGVVQGRPGGGESGKFPLPGREPVPPLFQGLLFRLQGVPLRLQGLHLRPDGRLLLRRGVRPLLLQSLQLPVLSLDLQGQGQDPGLGLRQGGFYALALGVRLRRLADGFLRPVDGGDHGGLLPRVALRLLQALRHGGGPVLRVITGKNFPCGAQKGLVQGQADLADGAQFQLLQLPLHLPDLRLQARHLPLQHRDLSVEPVDGGAELARQILLLEVQLCLALAELPLRLVQGPEAVPDLGLALVQPLPGLRQAVTDEPQELVVQGVDLLLIQRDLHRPLHEADGADAGHAVQPLQPGENRALHQGGELIDIPVLAVHRHILGCHHVRAHLDEHGSGSQLRQAPLNLVDGSAGLHQGAVHIGAVLVLQDDEAVVLAALAGDVLHPVEGREAVLQGLGHVGFHLLRTGPGIGGDHQEVGQVHLRQQVRLHPAEADKAQYDDQEYGDQDGKRLSHTVFRHSLPLQAPPGRNFPNRVPLSRDRSGPPAPSQSRPPGRKKDCPDGAGKSPSRRRPTGRSEAIIARRPVPCKGEGPAFPPRFPPGTRSLTPPLS